MDLSRVKTIADAVFYEGYILYPYRATAMKNRQRFNFGVLVPGSYANAQGDSEACTMQTECLVEGTNPVLEVHVRFLHLVFRQVFRRTPQAGDGITGPATRSRPEPFLEVNGKIYPTWHEAMEREVISGKLAVRGLVDEPQRIAFKFADSNLAGGLENGSETLYEANGEAAGELTRRQQQVQGTVTIRAQSPCSGLWTVAVSIDNTTPVDAAGWTREETLMHSLASTHTILCVDGGQFVSLLDPPQPFAQRAAACQNVGTWPVLVGDGLERNVMLSSPIILYDYPQIAPESEGDFFDGTEIDEMLALRIMTLTDDEKREMQTVDPRAQQVLQRTASLSTEHWQKLHGAIRGWKKAGLQGSAEATRGGEPLPPGNETSREPC